jgi:hypothetical protein
LWAATKWPYTLDGKGVAADAEFFAASQARAKNADLKPETPDCPKNHSMIRSSQFCGIF